MTLRIPLRPGCRTLPLRHRHRGPIIVVVVRVACGVPLRGGVKVVAVVVAIVTAIAAFVVAIVAAAGVTAVSDDTTPSSPAFKSSSALHCARCTIDTRIRR